MVTTLFQTAADNQAEWQRLRAEHVALHLHHPPAGLPGSEVQELPIIAWSNLVLKHLGRPTPEERSVFPQMQQGVGNYLNPAVDRMEGYVNYAHRLINTATALRLIGPLADQSANQPSLLSAFYNGITPASAASARTWLNTSMPPEDTSQKDLILLAAEFLRRCQANSAREYGTNPVDPPPSPQGWHHRTHHLSEDEDDDAQAEEQNSNDADEGDGEEDCDEDPEGDAEGYPDDNGEADDYEEECDEDPEGEEGHAESDAEDPEGDAEGFPDDEDATPDAYGYDQPYAAAYDQLHANDYGYGDANGISEDPCDDPPEWGRHFRKNLSRRERKRRAELRQQQLNEGQEPSDPD